MKKEDGRQTEVKEKEEECEGMKKKDHHQL